MSLDRVARLVAVYLLTLLPQALSAQVTEFTIPPNSLLPNYDRVSVGQREALEAGAYVARTDDALANWYNPAGLVQSEKTSLNASSNAYELTKTTLNGIGQKSSGTRFSPVGGFFGIVVGAPIAKSPNWRFGFGYTKPVSWSPSDLDGSFNLPAGGGTEAFGYTSSSSFGTVIPSLNGVVPAVTVVARRRRRRVCDDQPDSEPDHQRPPGVPGRRHYRHQGACRPTAAFSISFSPPAPSGTSPPPSRWAPSSPLPVSGSRGSTKITYSNILFDAGGAESDLAFRDTKAKLDYKIPLRATAGAAFRHSRGQVEVDVRYYGAEDEYDLFSSDSMATQITTDAARGPDDRQSGLHAGREPGPLDRELRPGHQLLALPVGPAARWCLQ